MNQAPAIRQFLIDKLRAKSGHVAIDGKMSLVGPGLFDSLGFITLIEELERHFKVEANFGTRDPSEYTSLDGLVRCLTEA